MLVNFPQARISPVRLCHSALSSGAACLGGTGLFAHEHDLAQAAVDDALRVHVCNRRWGL
jgi:hypothetical protein